MGSISFPNSSSENFSYISPGHTNIGVKMEFHLLRREEEGKEGQDRGGETPSSCRYKGGVRCTLVSHHSPVAPALAAAALCCHPGALPALELCPVVLRHQLYLITLALHAGTWATEPYELLYLYPCLTEVPRAAGVFLGLPLPSPHPRTERWQQCKNHSPPY